MLDGLTRVIKRRPTLRARPGQAGAAARERRGQTAGLASGLGSRPSRPRLPAERRALIGWHGGPVRDVTGRASVAMRRWIAIDRQGRGGEERGMTGGFYGGDRYQRPPVVFLLVSD